MALLRFRGSEGESAVPLGWGGVGGSIWGPRVMGRAALGSPEVLRELVLSGVSVASRPHLWTRDWSQHELPPCSGGRAWAPETLPPPCPQDPGPQSLLPRESLVRSSIHQLSGSCYLPGAKEDAGDKGKS